MKAFTRLSLVLALAIQAGSAQAQSPVAALQKMVAWQVEGRSAKDCEAALRSFESRNTLRPSESRAALRRCREDVQRPTGPLAQAEREDTKAR